MKIITILLTYVLATNASSVPKVYEEVIEIAPSENIRNIRNLETDIYLKNTYEPLIFNYHTAAQQDYLKSRYAIQQQVDAHRMANYYQKLQDKSPQSPNKPKGFSSDNNEEWQPMQPSVVPYVKNKRAVNRNNLRDILLQDSTDLEAAGLDIVESKTTLDRQDHVIPKIDSEIIYVHPSVIRQAISSNLQHGQTGYHTLNDLIGKNPNIQLEGLNRLLKAHSQPQYIPPAPKPFQVPTPINQNSLDIPNQQSRPNIVVDHDSQNIPTVTQQTPVHADQLKDIQKQLDDASKAHAEQVLAKAQQQAQAHVEAQHKAIEAAQKAIFEKVQSKLYKSNQALQFVQPHVSSSHNLQLAQPHASSPEALQIIQPHESQSNPSQPEALQLIQHHAGPVQVLTYPRNVLSTPTPQYHKPPPQKLEVEVQSYDPSQSTTVASPYEDQPSSTAQPFKLVTPTPHLKIHPSLSPVQVPEKIPFAHKTKPTLLYYTKNVQNYAPNHIHETVAQLQAEKTLLAQVDNQNKAILRHKAVNRNKVPPQNSNNHHTEEEPADTFQHIVYETKQMEQIYTEAVKRENEEFNDNDYAAKYAFGYRIKDEEDGNDYGHEEKRDGRSAEGSYDVLLPDGRRQKVSYYADESGYHARVTYENLAHHN